MKSLEWLDENHDETDKIPDGLDIIYLDSNYIIGIQFASGEYDQLSEISLSAEQLEKTFNDVQGKLGMPVKLMTGTRPS